MNVSRSWVAGVENAKPKGRPDAIQTARAAGFLKLTRRQAFVMAGYTTGEVLDLFGTEAEAEPTDQGVVLRKLDRLLEAVETSGRPASIEDQIAAGIEVGLRKLLAGALAEGLLKGPANQSQQPSEQPDLQEAGV